jgi:hypothetical protein
MSAWLGSDDEKRSFDFFLTRAAGRLGGFFNTLFWSREVLQAAIHYPPIRHLVVALGAAYEQFESREPNESDRNSGDDSEMRFALEQCNHSIRKIASLDGSSRRSVENMYCVLTASILFATFASIQGQFSQAIEHVRSGIRVLQNLEYLGTSAAFPVSVARLCSLLTSLYAQIRTMINDEARAVWNSNDPLVSDIEPVASFLHLDDAHNYVESLFNNALAFLQSAELSPPVTPKQKDTVLVQYNRLCCALRSSCNALDAFLARDAGGSDKKAIAVLRLHHTLLSVRLSIYVGREDEREILFDELEQNLVHMLRLCKCILDGENSRQDKTTRASICSTGLGTVMPLHMIAARCRNPTVRQEAVGLLRRARRREGLWDSTLVEKIVSTTIELEQSRSLLDLEDVNRPGSPKIPSCARIREVKLHFEGERSARVVFITVGQWRNKQNSHQRFIQW